MTPAERRRIEAKIARLAPWFHNLEIAGVRTAPDHFLGDYPRLKWRRFERFIPRDLSGQTVLDIGCNAGFYSVEMKRRGAARVVGIDTDPRYLAQARLYAESAGVDIELRRMSVYEVARLREKFDWVLFLGVLYHLRYPLLACDLLREHVCRDRLLAQSMLRGRPGIPRLARDYRYEDEQPFLRDDYPRLHFVEHRYAGDPTNWWVPNRACLEAMLRSAGFTVERRLPPDVYLCRVNEPPSHRGMALLPRRLGPR